MEASQGNPHPYYHWAYAGPGELEAQIAYALAMLEKIGPPWLEDPASTNDPRMERPKYERYAPLRGATGGVG